MQDEILEFMVKEFRSWFFTELFRDFKVVPDKATTGDLKNKKNKILDLKCMTPEQQAWAEKGICPKCYIKLTYVGATADKNFKQCQYCDNIWYC